MDAKEAIAERLRLSEQARALLDANPKGLTPAQSAQFDGLHKRISELKDTADRSALQLEEERYLAQSRGRRTEPSIIYEPRDRGADQRNREQADLALRCWALGGKRATSDQRAAAEALGIDPLNPELELRALGSGTGSAGGYAIGNEPIRAFDTAEKFFGSVRQLATVHETLTGAQLPIPTVDDTGNTAEIVSESSGITTTADPLFGQTVLKPFQYVSKAVIVPNQLLQDSAIPLAQTLGEELGKRMGRKQNNDFTVGAGTTLPFGMVVQSVAGKTATATNAVSWDEVFDLQASVDIAYANRPGVGFMMNPATANYLRKLKDSQNRYMWEMGIQGVSPAQGNALGIGGLIGGFPVYLNADMPSALTTGQKLILFGHFASYWIQDAGGPVLKRADELRLLTDETVFVAFRRSDGNLVNVNAVKHLKLA